MPPLNPQLYEIDLVVQSANARYTSTVATVLMPVIPKVGQDIYLEGNEGAGRSGSFRVTAVAYHVRAHKKTSRFKLTRSVTGLTGDLFGISLMVVPL